MGIIPYKTFTFDGVSSGTYGVYLTGEGVFNAPERAVEMISIPGRNGDYAMDQGRFENIEVTYKAGMYDVNESNFASKMSAFRNWICSKEGYVRLEDEYNPGEYRMAVYKSGLEVEHQGLINGEFDLVFDCKPQRWLTLGETASSIISGGSLNNPTYFDAEPLLAIKGYGDISFNGFEVSVENVLLGDVTIADSQNVFEASATFTYDPTLFNNGDPINVSGFLSGTLKGKTLSSGTVSSSDSNASFVTTVSALHGSVRQDFDTNVNVQLTVGTSATVTNTLSVTGVQSFPSLTQSWSIAESIVHNASAGTIDISITGSATTSDVSYTASLDSFKMYLLNIVGNSTKSALGNPTYIDCELGECYMIHNGEIVSLNGLIDLGSELPFLAPGSNTITYDNTVTELKVTPRWWEV